jgi:hypothetical protein
MTERTLDELGPVDYLVVEFPPGQQNFTGEAAAELLRLHDAGLVRVMDLVIIAKGEDGTVMAQELGDLDEMGELGRIEADLAETLAEEDVLNVGEAMAPGTSGPLASAPRSAAPAVSWCRRDVSRSRPSSPPSKPTRPSRPKEPDMPVRASRVAKAAVIAKPGPSPVAKAAVIAKPGPSPVAKAAVIAKPGRRRI